MSAVMQTKVVSDLLANFLVVESSSANPEIESWNVQYLPTFYFLDETGTEMLGDPNIGFFAEDKFAELLKKYIK